MFVSFIINFVFHERLFGGCLFGDARLFRVFLPVLLKIYKMRLSIIDFSFEVVAEFLIGFIFAVQKLRETLVCVN